MATVSTIPDDPTMIDCPACGGYGRVPDGRAPLGWTEPLPYLPWMTPEARAVREQRLAAHLAAQEAGR